MKLKEDDVVLLKYYCKRSNKVFYYYVVSQSGREVYASGVHPSVVMYQCVEGGKGQHNWVRSVVDTRQTRDVRAIVVTPNVVISGGNAT